MIGGYKDKTVGKPDLQLQLRGKTAPGQGEGRASLGGLVEVGHTGQAVPARHLGFHRPGDQISQDSRYLSERSNGESKANLKVLDTS